MTITNIAAIIAILSASGIVILALIGILNLFYKETDVVQEICIKIVKVLLVILIVSFIIGYGSLLITTYENTHN